MSHFHTIYRSRAADYDLLVEREDYERNLLPALRRICPPDGARIVDVGAGTGRFARILAPYAASILLTDASAHMLGMAAARLRDMNASHWRTAAADNAHLPVRAGSADLALAGWSFGHNTGWHPDTWRQRIRQAVAEMLRVLRPGGTAIIVETLGTGRKTPQPPSDGLAAYYAMLENELGFASTWIRTDYRFESLEEADTLTRFFFGDDLADWVLGERLIVLPECTGLWWRQKG